MTAKRVLTYSVLIVGLGAAGYLLYQTFREYSLSDIVGSVKEIPARNLATRCFLLSVPTFASPASTGLVFVT